MRTHVCDRIPVFKVHAQLCQALANHHRLAILYVLSVQGETCVGDLAAELGTSQTNVSQHLRLLKERMVVQARREGQTVYYSITNPKFIEGCTLIRQALIEQHQTAGEYFIAAGLSDLGQGPHRDGRVTSRRADPLATTGARTRRPQPRRSHGTR